MRTNTSNQEQPSDSMQGTNEPGTSPELTGGQGFTFEDAVAGVYVASLLGESTAPGLPGREVTHVSVQQGSLGQPLDDLVVQSRGVDQLTVIFSAQVKRKLVVSAAKGNDVKQRAKLSRFPG